LAVGALALLAVLVIAGCGGGGSSSSTTAESAGGGEAETASQTTGGGGESGGRYGNESSAAAAAGEAGGEEAAGGAGATAVAVVKVMNTPALGKVIVDSQGMTLYDFRKDKGTTSACYGECAVAWPPLLTSGEPKAAGGAKQSLLGTTKRKDGTVQVTYNGHPVYGFVEDNKPGETNGNDFKGFGGQWYALEPDGEEPADS
jgi:predicted lipoprotein with Yx(FWY)xxD motif